MILEFNNINKIFSDKKVLNNLTFGIQQGEYVGLIGNNGSGKSTIIHLLFNLIQPNSGSISVFDDHLRPGRNKFRNQLGIVLSEPYYIERFTVKKYLNFVGKFQNLNKETISERSSNLCSLLSIDGWENKKIKNLSSGNKMKVSIVAALLHNPKFLILDEPFTHLDIETTNIINKVLTRIKQNKTMLISSHNLDLVIELCDRFLILDNSEVKLDILKKEFSNEELRVKIRSIISSKRSIISSKEEFPNIDWLT